MCGQSFGQYQYRVVGSWDKGFYKFIEWVNKPLPQTANKMKELTGQSEMIQTIKKKPFRRRPQRVPLVHLLKGSSTNGTFGNQIVFKTQCDDDQ